MNRRRFLQSSGAGLVALGLGGGPLRANPYDLPIGIQLYTVRDHLEKDLPGAIEKVAAIGYREVEVGGFEYYGRQPSELRRILEDNGIKAVSTHFTSDQLRSNLEHNIARAKECGVSNIVLASLDDQDRRTLDAIKRDADWFNQVSQVVSRAGCRFNYHGHNFDYATVEGAVIYDELIRRTEPQLVNFELDCFWCVRAGRNPVDYFRRFPGRFPQLHIKDLKPGYPPTTGEDSRPGAFTEVGQGIIDWKAIFRSARQGGLKHFYVEQDECDRDSLESAKISYDYLHALNI